MSNKPKTFIAGFVTLAALVTGILGGEFYLNTISAKSFYVPDPIAQYELTQAKTFAKQKKWNKAAEILARNTSGTNVQAKYEYAMLQVKGWGVPRDLEMARILLLQAVQRPFKDRAKAAFELGRVYRKSKGEDCARIAFEWFTKAAQWGYTKAHNEIAKSYARGIGVQQNIELALKHYRIAIMHNSSSAALHLVELLAKGSKTLPANPEKALAVLNEFLPRLELAAKAGDARAARCIGRLYSNGLIMKADEDEALRWFSIAANLGDAIAMHDMAILILKTKKEFAPKEDVIELLNESIKRDYAAAITTLGRLHLKSTFGLPERKAVELFQDGALAGHPGSMEELGRLYLYGKHIQYDLRKARELAEQGSRLKHNGSRKLLEEIKQVEAKRKAEEASAHTSDKG